jgi:hypothetical protein
MTSEAGTSGVVDINSEQAFTPDPLYKIMGIFENSDAGVSAAEDLKANGFEPADIELFCGVPGAKTYDFSGKDHGALVAALRKFRNITFDRVIMDRYEQALRDGHCVMMVHIHKTPRRDEAADIMHRYGAVQVDHFGLAMTKAFPDNPKESETKYEADPLSKGRP